MEKRRMAMVGALVGLLLLAPAPLRADGVVAPEPGELIEGVVAVVGSRVVTRYDLRMAMMPRLTEIPEDLSKEDREKTFQAIQREVLENIIDNELVLVAGDRQGIEVSPKDVDGQLRRMFQVERGTLDPKVVEAKAREVGFDSAEHLRETIRTKILREQVVMMQVRAKVKVSDREVDQACEARYADGRYRAVRIAHVLFRLAPSATFETFQEVWSRGADLLKRVEAGTITFEDAALTESDDKASGEDDGIIGFVTEGTLEEDFEELVFNLPIGGVGGPVRSTLGIHVVKVVSEEWRTFDDDAQREEFRFRLRGLLEETAFETAYRRWLDEQRANTKIDIRL
ncbi:MAG: peptidylprolyl isomerase [Pseudomonadota bacterium]